MGQRNRTRNPVLAESLLDLRQEIAVQELMDLIALVVHDAVDAEVQVLAVELEELLQTFLHLVAGLCHVLSPATSGMLPRTNGTCKLRLPQRANVADSTPLLRARKGSR